MHSTKWSRGLVALLAAVAMTACSGSGKKSSDGSVSVSVAAASGIATQVWIRVYGNGVDRTIQAVGDAQNRVFTASFTLLPPGNYLVHGWGYDQAVDAVMVPPAPATYENRGGDIPLTIVAGQNTPLNITLQELNPAATLSHAPVISFISASMFNVEVGASSVTLTARATDADLNLLDWTWNDAGAGTFGTPGGSFTVDPETFSTTWTPAPGTSGLVTISLTVTDSTLNASTISILLNVVPAGTGTGSATITATINAVPMIVDPLVVANGQIPANTLTSFGTSAYDPDPIDTPIFTYDNDCGGQFSNQLEAPFDPASAVGQANPIISTVDFLAPSPAPSSGVCNVSVTVADSRGSSVVQNLVITVADPLIAYAPEFTLNTYASPATSALFPAAAGSVVSFQAEAFQRVGSGTVNVAPGSFSWVFPAEGTVAPESGSGTLSQRAWTLPAAPSLCTLPAGSGQIVPYNVSVTAIGAVPVGVAGPLDTTKTISIQVACP
jgi:hypothetical protein